MLGDFIKSQPQPPIMVHPEQKTFSENQIDELVETIKSRSFRETAYETAKRLQKTWKDFGTSLD